VILEINLGFLRKHLFFYTLPSSLVRTNGAQLDKMDLNSLKDTVSNLTLYDLKAGVRKVQNGELV
jgi:hypothetical protein